MVRLKTALAASTLALLTLTACGGVEEAADKAGEVTSGVAETAEGVKDQVAETAEGAKDKVAETADAAKDKVAETTEGAKDKIASLTELPAGIAGMTESAKTALDAVKSGDFDAAKAEATKLQDSWAGISDLVKEKSGDGHTKIEEGITAFTSGLEGDAPDAEGLKSTLTDLMANLKGILSA